MGTFDWWRFLTDLLLGAPEAEALQHPGRLPQVHHPVHVVVKQLQENSNYIYIIYIILTDFFTKNFSEIQ